MKSILELNNKTNKPESGEAKLVCPECGNELDDLYITRFASYTESGFATLIRFANGDVDLDEGWNDRDFNDADSLEYFCPECDYNGNKEEFIST